MSQYRSVLPLISVRPVPVTNPNSQLSSAISIHSQEPCEWFGHDLQVLVVKLEPILQLKVDCSDLGPVRDRVSLP